MQQSKCGAKKSCLWIEPGIYSNYDWKSTYLKSLIIDLVTTIRFWKKTRETDSASKKINQKEGQVINWWLQIKNLRIIKGYWWL